MENTQHQGSEKYHTSVMRDDEVLLFVEAALENAHDANEAIQDMRMMDAMLQAQRLCIATKPYVTKTATGRFRKKSGFPDMMESILNARVEGVEF